ncbi:MAG TPA: GntR family transcriptional regulator [Cellulomonas sp.]
MAVPPIAPAAPPQPGSARHAVHDRLRRQIVALQLPPGSPLSETETAARFGVSRTPVRESLILLADEGLVEIYPQRGSFVGRIRYDDVVTAQFVREALECSALDDGGDPVSDGDLATLTDLVAEQHRTDAAGDNQAFFDLDEAFHQHLMTATGHGAAWRIVGQAKAQMDRARRLSLPDEHKVTSLIGQHEAVVAALAAGDRAASVAHLREHLRVVLQDVQRIRCEQPGLFAS